MRAAVLREAGAPLTIEDVTLLPPRAGEVVVEIEAAGVCHSDYHYMTGDISCPLPAVLGHEGAGTVVEVSPDSTGRISVGDRVALMWRPRCGQCRYCLEGNPVLCQLGRVQAATGGLLDGTSRLRIGEETAHHFLGVSCFAERVVVPERSVVGVPADVPASIAAIAGCAVITGVGAVTNAIGACAGESLLIIGAGGVGLSAVMGAQLAGANPIIVVDMDDAKLELARRLGATHTINARTEDTLSRVAEVAPDGVAWAIEAIGRPQTIRTAFSALQPGGTVVAVGLARVGEDLGVPINELVQRQKKLVGSLYGSSNPLLDIPRILDLYRSGRLPLDELLGATYPLDAVNEAYTELARGSVGRSIIVP